MLVLSVIYFSIQLVGILLIFEKEQEDESIETITSGSDEGNINESEASSKVVLVTEKEEKEVKVNSLGIKLVNKA